MKEFITQHIDNDIMTLTLIQMVETAMNSGINAMTRLSQKGLI